ncbi:hypothetical protein BGZ65_003274 [Modicella reniformis]|uniref:Uncharacterized protein n=1 Tax=Modicella reniformis TaxID=1440133 RepID=A0A9P6MIA2_9FUNG|nr:hypothetical protein BGZ65_003274 [Modicella reniformis]
MKTKRTSKETKMIWITYVDERTVRLTGTVIALGENRKGYPVVSMYNERRKVFQQVKELAQSNEAAKKQLEDDIKPFRKVVKERQIAQPNLSRKVDELHSAQVSLRDARRELPEGSTKRIVCDKQTWEQPAVEDDCEHLDLSKLLTDSKNDNRTIFHAGTDYGIYHPDSQGHENEGVDLTENRMKGSMKITAGLLNNISHTSSVLAHRQKRLKNDGKVRCAMQKVSEASKVQQSSMIMESIDAVQTVRRNARDTLRQFEWSKKQRKVKNNQKLRSK